MDNIRVSTLLDEIDFDMTHKMIYESYWAKGIPKDTFLKSLKNSLCFGLFKDDAQIGFARVVTDKATFAYLGDVFIIPSEQKKGYSKILMSFIMEYNELQGLRRFCLGTKDGQQLYENYGFRNLQVPGNWMEIKVPDIYTK